jgi:phosphonoacetate hydrolase
MRLGLGPPEIVLTAEEPTPEWTQKLGQAPPIYSAEINYWLMRAALDILKNRPDIRVLYVHTTDYPMHMWAPEVPESKEHLARLDDLFGQAMKAAPDAAFLVTADHGMNAKTRCWDFEKVCAARGVPLRKAFSAGRDRYVKHNRGCSGAAYVYLKSPEDGPRVREIIGNTKGAERVLTREEAAREYKLMPSRIGDFVVCGDQDTIFGEVDMETDNLEGKVRSHRASSWMPRLIARNAELSSLGISLRPNCLPIGLSTTRRNPQRHARRGRGVSRLKSMTS